MSFLLIASDWSRKFNGCLKKALFYAYTVVPEVSFDTEPTQEEAAEKEGQKDAKVDPKAHRLTATEIEACSQLMAQISDHFSSTLFQPPAALHMECTDVFASLWMERAVQPAFSDGGTGHPFMTLKRLRGLDWKRDATETQAGARDEPCDECLQHMRDEWEGEVEGIWRKIDEWMKKE